MSKKVFYKYNLATDSYERVYPSRKSKMWALLRQFVLSIFLGAFVLIIAYFIVDFPKEKELREENEHLRSQLSTLGRQADQAIAVMEDLVARDNNFYRVMMQADPISSGQMFAGLERQRLYKDADSIHDDALVTGVANKLEQLDFMVYNQAKSYDYLRDAALSQRDRLDHIPAIQPVAESKLRQMASGYGYRRDPVYGNTKMHEGMDFSAPQGTPVYVTANGTVDFAGWKSGYGNVIEVNHGYNYTTRYAHLAKISVKAGDRLERGQQIGEVGNTGKSTGPHLHYEVRFKDQPQNPVNYYYYDLTPEQYDEMVRQADNAAHVMD